MPTTINKTTSNIWRRYLQYPCYLAVSCSGVEKYFGLGDVKRYCSSWFSSVQVLLLSCRPSAIIRIIPAIVIDAIEGQPCGAFAHIDDEIPEIAPPFTDGNTSPAVVVEARVVPVVASVDHVKPRIVCTASLSVSCVSVFGAIIYFGHGNLSPRFAASSSDRILRGSGRCVLV